MQYKVAEFFLNKEGEVHHVTEYETDSIEDIREELPHIADSAPGDDCYDVVDGNLISVYRKM